MPEPTKQAEGSEAEQIRIRLSRERIENLYHFTSVENLSGIAKNQALLSKDSLDLQGEWPCQNPGGNDQSHDLDRINGNWDKVALNFTPHTPMAYRKKNQDHLCFFVISTEVAGWEGVVFTDTNAAKLSGPGHQRGEGLSGLNLVNFGMVRCVMNYNPEWVKLVQAEALVPNYVPLSCVTKIAFISEASMKLGEYLWGNTSHPDFVIDKAIFTNTPWNMEASFGFPMVSNVILTNLNVDRNNVRSISSGRSCFQRQRSSSITAVIRLAVLAGTKARIKWKQGLEEVHEFQKPGDKIWWPRVSLDDMPDGKFLLEISLDNSRWATIDLEVVP
jgi:hypothetical protein